MITPRPSQWEVVRACAEHVLVEAGAGTGKTATVVARILYLLGVEVCGERYRGSARWPRPVTLADIVAITFTRQAAADLKRDLRRALRERGRLAEAREVDLARIGTIHGFCSDLVREYALRTGRTPVGDVLEEGEALAWAEGCVRDELLLALEAADGTAIAGLTELLGQWETKKIEPWVMRLMRAPSLLAAAEAADHSPEENALLELARRAALRLERRLVDAGKIDFDRMIAWTRDLLRDERGVRERLQRRIHTLIIDEFQDTDPLQQEIAYLLAEPLAQREDTPRLMLVGDPKQSIYRFRGADVTVWSRVLHDFQATSCGRLLPLQDNFRSVPSILSFVEATAAHWLDTPVGGQTLQDYEVRFAPVDPVRPEPEAPAVEFLLVPPDPDTGKARKAEDRRALEAAGIASRLLELHAGNTLTGSTRSDDPPRQEGSPHQDGPPRSDDPRRSGDRRVRTIRRARTVRHATAIRLAGTVTVLPGATWRCCSAPGAPSTPTRTRSRPRAYRRTRFATTISSRPARCST